MNKKIALLLIIFLVLPIVRPVTTFVIQETDKLSLRTTAADPDNDKLAYYYSSPLGENGEWQTDFGDAGAYDSTITVSDGQVNVTQDIVIIVNKKEVAPTIDYSSPNDPVAINESQSVNFEVRASDLNKDPLAYTWYLDGKRSGSGQYFTYITNYNDAGIHNVLMIVSDGTLNATKEWAVHVLDFDINLILDQINDVAVSEGETARLNIPDLARYGLSYTISEPLGNDNEWITTYTDAGVYDVAVRVQGNGFKGSKTARIIVNDVDRAPVFDEIGTKVIDENQNLTITLSANDPDQDRITYSVDKLPEGARIEGNIFTWQPTYDTVRKEDFVDRMVDKFSVLSKTFYLQFAASSKGKKIVQNVIITVKDVNRAPILEDIPETIVNEGDTIRLAPNAYDLDGDEVTLSYSGFMDSETYRTAFGEAGVQNVKVTASDGITGTSKTARIVIKHVNRAPTLEKIADVKATEGDSISIILNANDPDGDQLQYSASNAPRESSISGNVFFWTVPYDFAKQKETKALDLAFTATDGQLASSQTAHIQVQDKNRPPRIVNATKSVVAMVNQRVTMEVQAVDDDKDPLAYTWDFGLLEKYKATERHDRIFTTPGNKIVKVTVSDGIDSVDQVINVYVQEYPSKQLFNESVYIKVKKVNITYRESRVLTAQEVKSVIQKASTGGVAKASNTPPRIVDSTNNVAAKVNQPILLYVKAVDDDNDKLAYKWDFGFMDTHSGQYQQRTFSTTGKKTIKVTVSDGHYNVIITLNVNVVA